MDTINYINPNYIRFLQENENNNIDNVTFYILFFSCLIFIIFSTYYYYHICKHLIKNKKSQFFIYWIDYLMTSGVSIIFVLFYLIFLIFYVAPHILGISDINYIDRDKSLILNENYDFLKFLNWGNYFFLMGMYFLLMNNIIFDILHNIFLISKMKKIYLIQTDNIIEVYQICKEEKFNDIFNKKVHIYLLIILAIIDLIAYSFYGIYSKELRKIDENQIKIIINSIKENKFIFNIESYIATLQFLQVFLLIIIIIVMILSTYYKKKLLENNYYSENILVQKIYSSSIERISFHRDFFTFKTIIDFVNNIPILLFFALNQLSTIPLIISGICIGCYIFFMGAIFLFIEKENKMTNLSSHIKKIFCLKNMNFRFGQSNKQIVLENLNFEYNEDEVKIMQELSLTVDNFNESKNTFIKENKKKNSNSLLNPLIIKEKKSQNENYEINEKDFILNNEENYFILCKLIYLYFEQNQNFYKENEKGFEDNNLEKKKLEINNEEYLINIEKINQLSKINQKELRNVLKINSEILFQSIEEKEYKNKFKINNKIKEEFFLNEKDNLFHIESYFTEELFLIFPFYQITIKDILNSLNPLFNIKIFQNLINKKETNKKLNDEYNLLKYHSKNFFTYNSFLFFETYENDEINISNMKQFILNYNNYLMEIIKNMEYTFLPLIIGIFEIKILNKTTTVILYRNPLLYTQFTKFKRWISFFITETPEKIFDSINQGLLNLKEIEINDNILLNQFDYNELEKNLNRDMNFIKNLSFDIFPIINLFFGEEENDNNEMSGNFNLDEDSKNKSFNQILNNELSTSSIIIKKKTENNSEIFSLFEKEYKCSNQENSYSIKIFFTNFFRNNCYINDIEKKDNNKFSVDAYIDYINKQIFEHYIKKQDSIIV